MDHTDKQQSVNISMVDTLEKMAGYAKFMKYLVTKKMMVNIESEGTMYHYSIIDTMLLV